jgi:hypothetical protein
MAEGLSCFFHTMPEELCSPLVCDTAYTESREF